jgi:hypothetical protein
MGWDGMGGDECCHFVLGLLVVVERVWPWCDQRFGFETIVLIETSSHNQSVSEFIH